MDSSTPPASSSDSGPSDTSSSALSDIAGTAASLALDDALDALTDALGSTSAGLARSAEAVKRINRDLERYRSASERVEILHEYYYVGHDRTQRYCIHCSEIRGAPYEYPCPTVVALRGFREHN